MRKSALQPNGTWIMDDPQEAELSRPGGPRWDWKPPPVPTVEVEDTPKEPATAKATPPEGPRIVLDLTPDVADWMNTLRRRRRRKR